MIMMTKITSHSNSLTKGRYRVSRAAKNLCREKHGIPDGPIPFHLLLEDQLAKEAEEAADAAMEAAIARDSG